MLAVVRGLHVSDDARPRDVLANHFAFAQREKAPVLLVGEDRKKRLHMRNLATKVVRHAHCARRVGFDQRRAFRRLGHDVVDQHAAVDQIDLLALCHQRFAVPFKPPRVGNERGNSHLFEALLENFKFAPGWNFFRVHNGDLRFLLRTSPVHVTLQQRFEQLGAERIPVHFIFPGELSHHRKFVENLCERFCIARAGRRFSVVFGKFQGIGKQERVQPRRRAGRTEAHVNARQALLFFAQMQLSKNVFVAQGGNHHALAKLRHGLCHNSNAFFVFGRKKKGPQERAVDAIAKGQLGPAQALEQIFRKSGHAQKLGLQDFMPLLCRRRGQRRRCGSSGHAHDPCAELPAGAAADFCPDAALLGAPVKPDAAPIPSISSQRGQGELACP